MGVRRETYIIHMCTTRPHGARALAKEARYTCRCTPTPPHTRTRLHHARSQDSTVSGAHALATEAVLHYTRRFAEDRAWHGAMVGGALAQLLGSVARLAVEVSSRSNIIV